MQIGSGVRTRLSRAETPGKTGSKARKRARRASSSLSLTSENAMVRVEGRVTLTQGILREWRHGGRCSIPSHLSKHGGEHCDNYSTCSLTCCRSNVKKDGFTGSSVPAGSTGADTALLRRRLVVQAGWPLTFRRPIAARSARHSTLPAGKYGVSRFPACARWGNSSAMASGAVTKGRQVGPFSACRRQILSTSGISNSAPFLSASSVSRDCACSAPLALCIQLLLLRTPRLGCILRIPQSCTPKWATAPKAGAYRRACVNCRRRKIKVREMLNTKTHAPSRLHLLPAL